MSHSDDDGLVLPPRLASAHVVILPIYRKGQDEAPVREYCQRLEAALKEVRYHDERLRVILDDRDLRGGEKTWEHIKKGVPVRLEVGPRDVESDSVFMGRRDLGPRDKKGVPRADFIAQLPELLDEIQQVLFDRALARRAEATVEITNKADFEAFFAEGQPGGFAWCHAADVGDYEAVLSALKVTPRCIPIEDNDVTGDCIFTGTPGQRKIVFARSY